MDIKDISECELWETSTQEKMRKRRKTALVEKKTILVFFAV